RMERRRGGGAAGCLPQLAALSAPRGTLGRSAETLRADHPSCRETARRSTVPVRLPGRDGLGRADALFEVHAEDVVAPQLPDAALLVEQHDAVAGVVREHAAWGALDLDLRSRHRELVVVPDVLEVDELRLDVQVLELLGDRRTHRVVVGRAGV